jgi:hypothetical protein
MIDKLTLYTRDFSVKDSTGIKGFTAVPCHVNLENLDKGESLNNLLFLDKLGRKVTGSKAYLNDDLFNLTISQAGLNLQLNPSKPYHAFDLVPNDETLLGRLKIAFSRLNKYGINAGWQTARPVRIDLAKNEVMNQPVSVYNEVFRWLNVPRSKDRREYPEGYQVGNKSVLVSFYNKGLKARLDGEKIYTGDDLLRAELQFRNKASVKSSFEVGTLDDLLRAGLDHCKNVYRTEMNDRVFRSGQKINDQVCISYGDETRILKELKKQSERTAIGKYIQLYGLPGFFETFGTLAMFEKIMLDAGFSRQTCHKYKKQIEGMILLRKFFFKKNTVRKMYSELKLKFAS